MGCFMFGVGVVCGSRSEVVEDIYIYILCCVIVLRVVIGECYGNTMEVL